MRHILLFAGFILLLAPACKDKKKAPSLKETTPKETVSVPVAPPVQKEAPVPRPEAVKPDKYFLVSGSFLKQENAEKYKADLVKEGYKATIVTRTWGVNSDFFRVSYMGFSDRQKAINAMTQERDLPGKEHVWVLVKK